MNRRYLIIVLIFVTCIAHAQIVNIPDSKFKNVLLYTNCVSIDGDLSGDVDVDTNNDGEIQVNEAEAVITLKVSFEDISSLEGIQSFVNIENLICSYNQLTELDVSQLPNLYYLNCEANLLTSLDVTQNFGLNYLWFGFNQLSDINLSQNLALKLLGCNDNLLSSLDISFLQNLEALGCYNNQLTSLNISNGNNVNTNNMLTYGNPNLICIKVDDENAVYPECDYDFVGWCKDSWAEYSEECTLEIGDNTMTPIMLFPNPATDILSIESQEEISDVKIFDIQGKLIKQVFASKIDLYDIENGLYFYWR